MLESDIVNIYPMTPTALVSLNKEDNIGWTISKVVDKVRFSDRQGPWLLLIKNNNILWVHGLHDDNFKVICSN